jgi:hypothetical protein
MQRREFIAGLGVAAAWPLTTGVRQIPTRRVGGLNQSRCPHPLCHTLFFADRAYH